MISENTDVGFMLINIYLYVCVCVCVEVLKRKINVKNSIGIQFLPCNKLSTSPL